ncbi:MAG TPA: AAA family ATPase [Candidatus Acidoferrales bacterium]|nr:AAA family ATPase [Candidatus Acidoferrales bacterium]
MTPHANRTRRRKRASTRRGARAGRRRGHTIRCWDDIPNVFALNAPATEWMVEGILPRASVTLLAGEPGSYKTWLALALLRGVATGGEFLGRKCAQASVLYLDRENPLAVMRQRLAVFAVEQFDAADCHHPSTQNPRAGDPGFRVWGGWLADAPPGIGDIRILEMASERRPLIVFDSLIRFHAAADENSATAMAAVMADLRALANAGATVVVLHHKPKSEGSHYRGSSDIAGGVDMAWAVSRDRDAGLLRLECFKSRYAEEFSLTLRPELGSMGDFVVTNSPEASSEQTDIEKLAEAIRHNPGQPKSRIVEASGVRRGRARALLERFEGQCWQSKSGLNNAKLYFPNESKPSGQPPDLPTGKAYENRQVRLAG